MGGRSEGKCARESASHQAPMRPLLQVLTGVPTTSADAGPDIVQQIPIQVAQVVSLLGVWRKSVVFGYRWLVACDRYKHNVIAWIACETGLLVETSRTNVRTVAQHVPLLALTALASVAFLQCPINHCRRHPSSFGWHGVAAPGMCCVVLRWRCVLVVGWAGWSAKPSSCAACPLHAIAGQGSGSSFSSAEPLWAGLWASVCRASPSMWSHTFVGEGGCFRRWRRRGARRGE